MTSSARIVLDSVGPNGARLTTFELTFPRFILAEVNTHRMASKNTASSRAIPVERMIKRIEEDPAMPVFWGRANPGMQSKAELDEPMRSQMKVDWLQLRDMVLKCVRYMGVQGLHKQLANRPLETWMPCTQVITATHWTNMRALRVSEHAQPEFRDVMAKAFELYDASTPQELAAGQWHLPFVTGYDELTLRAGGDEDPEGNGVEKFSDADLCNVSSGRCAAVSYLNHDTGKSDAPKDIERACKLLLAGHMSPFEHVAQAMTKEAWQHYAMRQAVFWVNDGVPMGNLWGFRQFRKTLTNEHDFSLLAPAT